jgi:RNA polymerase sigma-70 factor (ECF subfamily)
VSTTSPAPARPGPPEPAVDRTAAWRYLRALGASRVEADDLAQETMLVACRIELPDGHERRAAFLRGIARNLWLRSRRWWQRRRECEIATAVDQLWVDTAARDAGDELVDRLQHCLDELQPRARQALELHYRDGLDWRSVATRIGMKPNGTKTLAQRARQALRTCIDRRNA